MTQTERDMQLVESQPLTVKNAHRVAMIRKKESTEPPVPFHFRKKHLGMESFVHFSGKPEDEKELRPADFKDWEVTKFKYPGYWKSHSTLTLLATQNYPFLLKYDCPLWLK